MKLLNPKQLHKWLICEKYDLEISYLEGPSARIISGCPDEHTKLISWIHVEQHHISNLAASFRSEKEARECYERFHRTICVSQFVKDDFCRILGYKKPCEVLYNTVESDTILTLAKERADRLQNDGKVRLVAVGSLKESKGYMRLLRTVKRLCDDGYQIHLYVLGIGSLQTAMEGYIRDNELGRSVTLLGYDTNPYKYVSQCDLFVCASFAEGFSTAATESLIVGTPVCTVDVSGMKEMLGENNEYGIVTENSEEALYRGIKHLLDDPALLAYYREKVKERGGQFHTGETVRAVEDMLIAQWERI